jgi:hypothetical protein
VREAEDRRTDDVSDAFLRRDKAILSRVFDVSLHFEQSDLHRKADLQRGQRVRKHRARGKRGKTLAVMS